MLEWVAIPRWVVRTCDTVSVVASTVACVDRLARVQDFEDILQLCNLRSV